MIRVIVLQGPMKPGLAAGLRWDLIRGLIVVLLQLCSFWISQGFWGCRKREVGRVSNDSSAKLDFVDDCLYGATSGLST